MAADPHKPDTAPPETRDPRPLEEEVRALRQELTFLREHRMFQLYQSVPRILLYRFASGMAAGLGTVIGATVLLSLIVWSLSQIEFIPIIGEWAVRIAGEISTLTQGSE
jgi:hypothetical protein